jgi:hypothetical protein
VEKAKIGSGFVGSQRGYQRSVNVDPNPGIPFVEATMPTPTKKEAVIFGVAALLILLGYYFG